MFFLQTIKQHQTSAALIFFAILIVVFYGNTLANGWVFDDFTSIVQNEYLRSFGYLPKVITGCLQEFGDGGCGVTRYTYYRPVQYLSIFLAYHIVPQPWFFHLINLVYFWGITALVFLLAKLLTKNFFAAALAGFIFAVHPIQSEVVNYISAVPELTVTLFSLLAVIFYVRWRQKNTKWNFRAIYLFYTLALFSKEPAIVLPVFLFALDILFFRVPLRAFRSAKEWLRFAYFIPPAVFYFALKIIVMGTALGGGVVPMTFAESMHARVLLFAQYARELIFPFPLSIFHPFEKSADFLSLPFILSASFAVLFAAGIFFSWRARKPIFTISLLWFALFLSPVLILLVGEENQMLSERFVFAPSIGFALLAAYAIHFLREKYAFSWRISAACCAILIGAAWFAVFPRNHAWQSEETMDWATIEQQPEAHEIRRNLAELYFNQGNLEDARTQFETLISRAPGWKDITMAHKGMGDYWRAKGDKDQALASYLQSTQTAQMNPRDWVPFNDAGALLAEKEQYLLAFTYFCQSLNLFPAEQAQQNFDAALSRIDEQYIKSNSLGKAIKAQFTASSQKNIRYLDKRCASTAGSSQLPVVSQTCQWAFALNPSSVDIIAPMLITTQAEITNSSFDPDQNVIILETEAKYEDEELTFLFPTCQRTYYEAAALQQL